jgi:hypothetical protein
MGERVLVIDGDPVGRGLTRALTDTNDERPLVHPRPGFSEVVCGRPLVDSVVAADANPQLQVLTSGMDPELAISRWSSQAIKLALDDATSQFDFVMVDVPPVGSSSYGVDLAGAIKNLLLVIPYLDPVKGHLQLPERLRVAGVNLLGYVFNGAISDGQFRPYFPILHTSRAIPDAPRVRIPAGAPALSTTSAETVAHAGPQETAASEPMYGGAETFAPPAVVDNDEWPDDITQVVPSVSRIESSEPAEVRHETVGDPVTQQQPPIRPEDE